MDYQNQNEQERNEQGTFQQKENQGQQQQGNDQMPTSAGGNSAFENQNRQQEGDGQQGQQSQQGQQNQQPQDSQQNWEQRNDNVVSEDAQSRMQDDTQNESQPQIDEEGEFTNQTGWTREEGLSDDERRNAEEEDLDGRRSDDSSVL